MQNKIYILFIVIFYFLFGLQNKILAQENVLLYNQIDSLFEQALSIQNYELAQQVLTKSKQIKDNDATAYALSYIGYYYIETGAYEAGILNYQKLYRIGETINDKGIISDAYFGLGEVYSGLKIFNQALEYYRRAEKLAQVNKDTSNLSDIYNGIGNIYSAQDLPQQALDYLLLSRNLSLESNDDKSEVLIVNHNIGIVYAEMGQAERSIPYLEEILAYEKEIGDSIHWAVTYGNLAYAYQNIPDYERAFIYFDTSLYYSNLFKQDEVTYATYKDMSEAYLAMDSYKKALDYQKKSHRLEKIVIDRQTQRQITALEVQFDTERTEKELLLAQNKVADLKINRQRMYLLSLILMAISVIVFLFYRKAKEDARRKQQLLKIEEELLKSKLKNKELKTQQLQNELNNKQSDLTNLALDIARKNDFSNKLVNKLNDLQQSKTETLKTKLHNIILFVGNHLRINEDLATLQNNIEQINQNFYLKLDTNFSNLSANDKYVLGLIRLNLSNKDIAAIKGISAGSAKVLRYRLRKKLALTPEIDFAIFLQRL